MSRYDDDAKAVRAAADLFPYAFGLRAFPGDVFRVSIRSSYISDSGVVTLHTEVKRSDGWKSFAKGTVHELMAEVTNLS